MECVVIKARKISKSLKGNRGSAVNYSKYLTRELQDVDYTEKGKVLDCGIIGTEENVLSFWKKAEERENQTKRKDSARFAKEYILRLPYQLPLEIQNNLCKEVAENLSKGNRVVSWYQHEPDKEGDPRNFHCHFLMSEREYINGRFADKKNRDWNSKQTLNKHKEEVAEIINRQLEINHLPKIQVGIEEDRETIPDKTEKQIKAERALRKRADKLDKKIKLAEVKLNGLGRNKDGLTNSINRDSKSDNGLEKQFSEFNKLSNEYSNFQRTENALERAERERKEKLERERREAEEERIRSQRRLEAERSRPKNRSPKSIDYDSGFSR